MLLWLLAFFVISLLLAKLLGGKSIDMSEKIQVVQIKGAITGSGIDNLVMKSQASDDILKKLKEADEDKSVKGIILEIDSPGGKVVPTKEISDKVKSLEKPVVALIRGSATSGGYWVASAADYVIADDLSLVGSIGVLGSFFKLKGLLERYDIEQERFVAGEHKDIASPFKDVSDEEREILQYKLDRIHSYFLNEVRLNRNLSLADMEEVSDAKFFLGEEAMTIGLVDALGNIDDAFNKTKELADAPKAKLIRKEKEKGVLDLLSKYGLMSSYYIGRGIGAEIISISESDSLELNV